MRRNFKKYVVGVKSEMEECAAWFYQSKFGLHWSRFQSQRRFTAVTGRAVSKVAASAELQGKNLRTIHSSARPVFCRRTKWRIVGGSGLDLVFSPQVVGEAGQRFNLARLRLCLRV